MTRRNSFARGRGGFGGKCAPPDLSSPFMDLSGESRAEQDSNFSPIKFIIGLIVTLILFTFFFVLASAVRLIIWK